MKRDSLLDKRYPVFGQEYFAEYFHNKIHHDMYFFSIFLYAIVGIYWNFVGMKQNKIQTTEDYAITLPNVQYFCITSLTVVYKYFILFLL